MWDRLTAMIAEDRLCHRIVRITRNMYYKFYLSFMPVYGYLVSGVRIQLPGAFILTLFMKLHEIQ
jgi:hypothetical protein